MWGTGPAGARGATVSGVAGGEDGDGDLQHGDLEAEHDGGMRMLLAAAGAC